ncbi:MAG: BamA/TamA family outer membrane protein [Balneolales bacterium]
MSEKTYCQDSELSDIKWVQDQAIGKLPETLAVFDPESDSLDHILQVKRFVLETLTDVGYFSGRIDSVVNNQEGQVLVYSSRGDRFSLADLEINYADSRVDTPEYLSRISSDTPYTHTLIEGEISRIISYYEKAGYPLVAVQPENMRISPDSNLVSIDLTVNLNGLMKASGVKLSNLQRNDPIYLERASGVSTNQVITPEMMRDTRRNLQNTGLFEHVAEPSILVQDDKHFLYFEVIERSTNAFDILLGYVPQNDGTNAIVGTGKVRVRNAIWQGSTLDMAFDRIQKDVTKLNLAIKRDWIMEMPLGLGGSFNFHQQDSSYQIRNIGVKSTWAWTSTFEISGSLRRESASSNSNPALPVRVLNGHATFAGIGMHYLDVDYRGNPTHGIEIMANLETGIKQTTDIRKSLYTSNNIIRQQEVSLIVRKYFNPFHRQVLALRASGYFMESPEFTESDLFRFGGANSIRGYREDQFLGSRLGWGDLEYRYLLDEASYAFLFGAYGMYHRPQLMTEVQSLNTNTGTLHAWGFGFSYLTPIGNMQFTYALSPEDPISNGKIHFGVTKDF